MKNPWNDLLRNSAENVFLIDASAVRMWMRRIENVLNAEWIVSENENEKYESRHRLWMILFTGIYLPFSSGSIWPI